MSRPSDLALQFEAAAEVIRAADALLVGAGAGMGVDSGLPDFRGDGAGGARLGGSLSSVGRVCYRRAGSGQHTHNWWSACGHSSASRAG